MNTHYIPRLLLRHFANLEKVNTYDFTISSFTTKKLKNTFSQKDMFDEELERSFATKLEGPFGDLLNNKLLKGERIAINRKENLLIRKFLMINNLRAPITSCSWEETIERTKQWNHPTVQARDFLLRHHPEIKVLFDEVECNEKNFVQNLKKAMEIDSLEDIAVKENLGISKKLQFSARRAMVATIAIWDCEEAGQEFILPKLPGISQMDYISIFHKSLVIKNLLDKKKDKKFDEIIENELQRLLIGSITYMDNFNVCPLSPTRAIVCFSPYFRAFFPIMDEWNEMERYPSLLEKEQFDRHFFEPMRMELFRPCEVFFNQYYRYSVKHLTAEETQSINAMFLDMETEEFAFHDFNKLRDSFWYYDHKAKFADKKKHDFRCFI